MQTKPQWDGTSPIGIAVIQETKVTSVGEAVEWKKPLCSVGGTVNSAASMENSIAVPQKKN